MKFSYKEFEKKVLTREDWPASDFFVFRMLYCFVLAFRLWQDSHYHEIILKNAAYFISFSFFRDFGLVDKPSDEFLYYTQLIQIGSIIAVGLGLFVRLNAVIALVSFCLVHWVVYSVTLVPASGYVWHTKCIIPFILLLFIFTDKYGFKDLFTGKLTNKKISRWPFNYILILICFSYTSALLNRVIAAPVEWFTGESLSYYFLAWGHATREAWVVQMGHLKWLCFLGSFFTTIVELVCWTAIFPGRHKIPILLATVVFHYLIYLANFANFIDWFGIAYLVFIPYTSIYLWIKGRFIRG